MARDRKPQASPVQDHEFLRSLYGPAIYFVLPEPLRRGQFDQVCAVLEAHSDDSYGEQQGTHWERLQDRLTGLQPRWGTMVPAFDGPLKTPEDGVQFRAAWHAVPNLVSKRGYRAYRMDGLACTLDYFNPANELRVPYAGAGELVLALVLHSNRMLSGSDDRDIAHNLHTADELFAALQEIDSILQPEWVVGTYSLASILLAYRDGRMDREIRPWELQFTLSALPIPESLSLTRLRGDLPLVEAGTPLYPRTFRPARVDAWRADRVLFLATPGLSSAIGNELAAAAKIFGRTDSQETVFPVYTFRRGPHGEVLSHRHRSRMDRNVHHRDA